MKSELKFAPTETEPDETMFFSDPLGEVGQGLALAIQLSAGNLEPNDREAAARLLRSIFKYSVLAEADEEASSGIVGALLHLQEAAFTLCDSYPDLRNEVNADLETEFAAIASSEVF